MSADNYTLCPNCVGLEQIRVNDEELLLRDSYGKVSIEEFEKTRARAVPREIEETLREDYELGMDSNFTFYTRYSANCSECEYHYEFKHDEVHQYSPKKSQPKSQVFDPKHVQAVTPRGRR